MACIRYVTFNGTILKGHGNEADFQGFLQKLVPHRSLTLKEVNREDKRSRRHRDRDFAKFERSRRYRER